MTLPNCTTVGWLMLEFCRKLLFAVDLFIPIENGFAQRADYRYGFGH